MINLKFGIIGAGNMATAIINGILKKNILKCSQIFVCDIDEKKLKCFELLGLSTTTNFMEVFDKCNFITLAIKPQVFKNMQFNLCQTNCKNKFIISIMAGITIAKIIEYTKINSVCRIMPNTPCMLGEGMSALCFNNFELKEQTFVKEIFNSLGKTIEINEIDFDAVTSISGSGPAYVYEFIKSMINAGVEGGLNYDQSKLLTIQTFKGALNMVDGLNTNIDELISSVCSKGGTTIEAITSFRTNNLEQIIKNGIQLCKHKSQELSK